MPARGTFVDAVVGIELGEILHTDQDRIEVSNAIIKFSLIPISKLGAISNVWLRPPRRPPHDQQQKPGVVRQTEPESASRSITNQSTPPNVAL